MARKKNVKIGEYEYAKTSTTLGQPIGKNGKPTQKQFYGESLKEVERQKEEYEENIKNFSNGSYNPNYVLFSQMFENWFWNVLRLKVSDATFSKYNSIRKLRIINAPYYSERLIAVNSMMIQIHYNAIAKESINKVIEMGKIVGAFSKYCYEQGFVKRDFTLGVVINKKKATKKSFFNMDDEDDEELLFLSDQCQRKLIQYAQKNPRAFIFVFLLATGLRVGEAFALEPKSISEGYVKVRKSMKKYKNVDTEKYVLEKGPLKTKSSRRDVPLPDFLETLLEQFITEEKKKHLSQGANFNRSEYLFTTGTCSVMDYSNFRRLWKAVLKAIDEPYIKPHALRHTYCSNLLKADVHIKKAALLMGHSTTKLVDQVYSHFAPDDLSSSVDKLNERMAKLAN